MIARLLLLLFLLGIATACPAQDVEIDVTVTSREVPANGQVEVQISVTGPGAGSAILESQPPGKNLLPSGNVSTSSNIQIIKGQMTATKVFSLGYVPSGTGSGEVPSFAITVAGRQHHTDPVPIRITQATATPPQGSGSPEQPDVPVRVLSEISRDRIYQGESVLLQYRLLFRHRVTGLLNPQALEAPPSFVAENLKVDRQVTRTKYEGRSWQEVVLFKQRLTPTRAGHLRIDPVVFELEVDAPGSRREFFSFSRSINIRRTAPGLEIEVRPLPAANQPLDFSGAVGRFEMSASLDRTELAAGEASALTVTLSGTGSLEAATPPRLPEIADIRFFDPEVDDSRRTRRIWIYPVVPQSAGEFTIPPIRWSYFDPSAESYHTIETEPLPMSVSPAEGMVPPPRGSTSRRIQPLATDLRFIKPAPASLTDRRADIYRRAWFWMLVGLPWVAIPLVMLAGWQRRQFEGSAFARERRAAGRARKRLDEARSNIDQGKISEALRSSNEAMASYVADRAQRSAQGLTYETLAALALEGGASRETAQELRQVVEEIDELRYTPLGSSPEEILRLVEQAGRILARLEKEWR